MVSNKFEGIGGKWYPIYIPVLVPKEMVPEFESVASRSRHAMLLDEEGVQATVNLWNSGIIKEATDKNELVTKEDDL